MNKIFTKTLFILMAILFIGCSNEGLIKSTEVGKNENEPYAPKTEAGKTFKSFASLMVNYAEDGIETVGKYVDLNANGRGYSLNTIDGLSMLLPNDLSTLKRVAQISRGEETEISLDEELKLLAEAFEQELNEIKPDPTAAQSLEYCDATTDGVIIGGDVVIKNDNIVGAMTIEFLNAEAKGQSLEAINDDLSLICDDLELNQEETGRGHRVSDTKLWDNGTIYYYWGNITDEYKTIIREAMDEWENKTNNAVRFQNAASLGAWFAFLARIHIAGVYTIQNGRLNKANGRSNLGYHSGNTGRLTIDDESLKGKTKLIKKGVCLHELGHMIGLSHEHQRWDRDEYVTLVDSNKNSNSNYAKEPRTKSGWRWENRWYRILWWKIRIPTWCYFTSYYSITSGTYDYLSIMHYSGAFEAKKKQQGYTVGKTIRRLETLSSQDIDAVKRMY